MDDNAVVQVYCPRCEVLCRLPVRYSVAFPEEAEAVLGLVSGRLNVHRCHVCTEEIGLDVPMVVSNREAGAVATLGIGADDLEELRTRTEVASGRGIEILPHGDREDLRETVAGWLESYLTAALDPFLSDAKPERNAEGVMPHQHPLALLYLRRTALGEFSPFLRAEPPIEPEEQRRIIGEIQASSSVGLIDGLFTHAFHHDGIATVLDLVQQHLPVECLDGQVLGTLVERCIDVLEDDDPFSDPYRLDRAFRYEYLCAVAHTAAGKANPRGARWPALSFLLFTLSRSEVEVPEPMLLNEAVLQRTIEFGDAWNVVSPLLGERERQDDLEAWFDHIGWGDRYRQEWAQVPFEIGPGDLADLDPEEFAARIHRLLADADRDVAPAFAGQMATILLRAGRRDSALQTLFIGLDALAEIGDWTRLGQAAIDGASLMNRHLDYAGAHQVLTRHLDRLLDEDVGCELRYSLFNEIGNALRYQNQAVAALEAYDFAGELMDDCDEVRPRDLAVLRRNRAIILRELNSFDQAAALLEAALEEDDPSNLDDRLGLLVSLARTYVDAGLPERALPYAEEAAGVPFSSSRRPQRIEVLLALVAARVGSRPGSEVPELSEALDLAESFSHLQTVAAAATLHHGREAVIDERTIARAQAILADRLRRPDSSEPPTVRLSAAFCLGEWELSRDNGERAREIVADLNESFDPDSLPWMVSYLEARLPETGVEKAWALMRRVLERLDGDVPDVAGVGFATPYLAGKTDVQRFLLLTLRSALESGHAKPIDCIPVFEFLNGREMRGIAAGVDRSAPLERLGRAAAELPILFVLLLEYEDELQAVWVRPRTDECELASVGLDAPALRSASVEFSAQVAVALTDAQMEATAAAVEPVLRALGAAIEPVVTEGEHICILPSPALLGLPLHAVRGADGTLLLERHGISLAPNLSVVCRLLEENGAARPDDGLCTIAAVWKRGDGEDFIASMKTAAQRIADSLGETPVNSLVGVEADKARVLEGIERSDHFVFLGHGARAPREHGRGLCVAGEAALPTALLPVDVVPELRRFMVDAGDLEELSRTAAVVTSMACSSGRSFAGDGGTRLGLERALFTGGTRTVLAPLWDVNAPTALRFLETFYETWLGDPPVDLAEAHRRTCLSMEAAFGRLFLWAPFVLNGDWR